LKSLLATVLEALRRDPGPLYLTLGKDGLRLESLAGEEHSGVDAEVPQ